MVCDYCYFIVVMKLVFVLVTSVLMFNPCTAGASADGREDHSQCGRHGPRHLQLQKICQENILSIYGCVTLPEKSEERRAKTIRGSERTAVKPHCYISDHCKHKH